GLDEGRFRRFPEDRGGDLPTGIAVDAGRVHEEVARDVFRHSLFRVCHDRASLLPFILPRRETQGRGGRPRPLYPPPAATTASSFRSNMPATEAIRSSLNWPNSEEGLSYSTQVFPSSFS